VPPVEVPNSFKRELDKKEPRLAAAITECVLRLAENPRHPGLQTHPMQGHKGVFEAYVDRKNRVTFHYAEGRIVLRRHCNHDILKRP
jgi:hypothetical protein